MLIGKMHLSPHPMLLPPVPRVTELVMLGPRALISISSIASSNPSQKGLYLNYHPPATNCSQGLRVLTHTFQLSPTASLSLLCLEEGSGSQDRFSLCPLVLHLPPQSFSENYEASQMAGGTGTPYITGALTILTSPERKSPEKAEPLRDGCEET